MPDINKTPVWDEALSAVPDESVRDRSYSAVMASGVVPHVRASSAGSVPSKRSARAAGISRPHAAHGACLNSGCSMISSWLLSNRRVPAPDSPD